MRKSSSGGLVYSTEGGRMCPGCRRPLAECACAANAAAQAPKGDGIVRVSRESKGRGGKVVTLVRGLDGDVEAIGKQIRTLCGAGGTVKDGVIEVQGDHCERVVAWLEKAGKRVRRAGG